ncbi:MAG: hypothetical protein EOM30_07015 [Clostridia bacterium]|nr:hypothetical protein [Clostridia bacterium]NLS85644.1 hypothetical protein [Oscillospiraceae bacterium]
MPVLAQNVIFDTATKELAWSFNLENIDSAEEPTTYSMGGLVGSVYKKDSGSGTLKLTANLTAVAKSLT